MMPSCRQRPWSELRTKGWLALFVGLASCAAPQRATVRELHHRAVYDLGCPAERLALHRTGARTQAASGCGRRLIYIEHCDAALPWGEACAWRLDTPTFAHVEWPQQHAAMRELERQELAAKPPEWPVPAACPTLPVADRCASKTDPLAGAAAPKWEGDTLGEIAEPKRERSTSQRTRRNFATELYDTDVDEPAAPGARPRLLDLR
ncbi:MAG: hypothetical protein EXR75_10890 [Myxococcales bacterium]|nr:hypothetical protein [Myxococcales bacterium]